MTDEQFNLIKKAIDIIEKEMKFSIDLNNLSSKVNLSKYHLHRLFKSITGKSLISYVRARKLSCSINELLNTDLNIIDIANEYNFEYEQSYIRAFKQQYNITPSQYRKMKTELLIEQKIDVNSLNRLEHGMLLEPKLCIKPEFYIQGIETEIIREKNLIDNDANKHAINFEKNFLPLIKNAVDKNVYIGLVTYKQYQVCNSYIASVEVSENSAVSSPFVIRTIPTHEYAVFKYIGFHSPYETSFSMVKEAYDYMEKWKAKTAYTKPVPYHFEKIDLKICSKDYCEMDIYVPIEAE